MVREVIPGPVQSRDWLERWEGGKGQGCREESREGQKGRKGKGREEKESEGLLFSYHWEKTCNTYNLKASFLSAHKSNGFGPNWLALSQK